MAESEEEPKSHLKKVTEESEKVGLKLNIQKMKIMVSGPLTSWQIDGEKMETVRDLIFGGYKITEDGDCSHKIKRRLLLRRKAMTKLESILKSRDFTLPTKVCLVNAVVFPVVMYVCESWNIKKAEHWTIDAFECKEIKQVNPKGNQSWIFTGQTDAEAEGPILWPPDAKTCRIRKDPDAGKDWGQEEKGASEDEMIGWHHKLDGHEFKQDPGAGEGQGSWACCNSRDLKKSDTTGWLNNKNISRKIQFASLSYRGSFPGSSTGKESACNVGDPSSIPGSERSTGEGIGYPLQYFGASLVA